VDLDVENNPQIVENLAQNTFTILY